jgi:hypothetical protein
MDVWKGKENPPKAVSTERGEAPISVRVRGEDDNTDNDVARERAGEFGSIGIPATGEEGGKDPSREEERGKKRSKVNCVLSSSFQFQFNTSNTDSTSHV